MNISMLLLAGIFSGAVFAQGLPANEVVTVVPNPDGERLRIRAERDQIDRSYSMEEENCYQRFAVNDCIGRARTIRREGLADLRRQELSISSVEARQKGADQLFKSETRTSEQAMREAETRLLNAQSGQKDRMKSIDERAAARALAAQQETERTRELQKRLDDHDKSQKERETRAQIEAERREAFEMKQRAYQRRLAGRTSEIKRSEAPASQ
jgi:colicin import membrane protein